MTGGTGLAGGAAKESARPPHRSTIGCARPHPATPEDHGRRIMGGGSWGWARRHQPGHRSQALGCAPDPHRKEGATVSTPVRDSCPASSRMSPPWDHAIVIMGGDHSRGRGTGGGSGAWDSARIRHDRAAVGPGWMDWGRNRATPPRSSPGASQTVRGGSGAYAGIRGSLAGTKYIVPKFWADCNPDILWEGSPCADRLGLSAPPGMQGLQSGN